MTLLHYGMVWIMQWLQTPSKDSSLGSFDDFRDTAFGGGLAPPSLPANFAYAWYVSTPRSPQNGTVDWLWTEMLWINARLITDLTVTSLTLYTCCPVHQRCKDAWPLDVFTDSKAGGQVATLTQSSRLPYAH